MTNQPPIQITTPPEGYEWAGYGHVDVGTIYAKWKPSEWHAQAGRWFAAVGDGGMSFTAPILRKVKPPTVLVELPRVAVEILADTHRDFDPTSSGHVDEIEESHHYVANACRAALEAEDD